MCSFVYNENRAGTFRYGILWADIRPQIMTRNVISCRRDIPTLKSKCGKFRIWNLVTESSGTRFKDESSSLNSSPMTMTKKN